MSETGEWIEHDGGPCPVDRGTLVECRWSDGMSTNWTSAGSPREDWIWLTHGTAENITAYRVVKP